MHQQTKLCCANARVQRRQTVWLDRRAEGRIERIKARYVELLGREVSTSIAVRAALELLEQHLERLSGEEDVSRELARVAFHVR